jgi:hypothetical protein
VTVGKSGGTARIKIDLSYFQREPQSEKSKLFLMDDSVV